MSLFKIVGKLLKFSIVVLAVTVYHFHTKYYDTTPCNQDPPIEIQHIKTKYNIKTGQHNNGKDESLTWPNSCQLFSSDYEEARSKFRTAIEKYPDDTVQLISIPIPNDSSKQSNQRHNDDEDTLTIDVAVFKGNSPKYGTIIHSSGLHGVEGYAGSAIQLAILEKFDDIVLEKPQNQEQRPTVIFIHSMNPVGMKEFRRCNENNVDLNRNFISSNDKFTKLIQNRDPNIAHYQDYKRFLCPPYDKPPTAWFSMIGIWISLLPRLVQHGYSALKRSMVTGQYHHREGIFYGGQSQELSTKQIINLLHDDSIEIKNFIEESSILVWIDTHTGLGPFGKDSLHYYQTTRKSENDNDILPKTAKGMQEKYFTTSYNMLKSITAITTSSTKEPRQFQDSSLSLSSSSSSSNAFHGYDLTVGMLTSYLAETHSHMNGLYIVQEFGTLPAILVGKALILDNIEYQYYVHQQRQQDQPDYPSYRSIRLKQAFYPQSTVWRSSIMQRGVALFSQAMDICYDVAHHKGPTK